MKRPALVVGGDGLIGRTLTLHLRERGEPVVVTTLLETGLPDAIPFDLAASAWPALPEARAAILCAAVTSQEQCRRDPAGTRQINVVQTLKLIEQLIGAETFVVFISTNLVFDGCQPQCPANAPFSPQAEYGRQKAEVEQALAQWPDRTAVVRLTKVFHPGLPLLQNWRRELEAGRPVKAFADYRCSPIPLRLVVAGLARIALERRPGCWQFSGPADVSYAELAQQVARHCGTDTSLVHAAPAPTGMLEHLPAHTTLDAQRARRDLQLVFPPVEEVLAECLDRRP